VPFFRLNGDRHPSEIGLDFYYYYATENIKNSNVPISAANLAAVFQQPFDLPASCEASEVFG
jgi:hypothetical protein